MAIQYLSSREYAEHLDGLDAYSAKKLAKQLREGTVRVLTLPRLNPTKGYRGLHKKLKSRYGRQGY